MLFSTFSILSVAIATPAVIRIESNNAELQGRGIAAFHEDPTYALAVLADGAEDSNQYDYDDGSIHFSPTAEQTWTLAALSGTLQFSGEGKALEVNGAYLTIDGNPTFYACHNISGDTYRYTDHGYWGLKYYPTGNDPVGCEEVRIRAIL